VNKTAEAPHNQQTAFCFTLQHIQLKILKKLRTASLNSEFTGSYKKKVYCQDIKPRPLLGVARFQVFLWFHSLL